MTITLVVCMALILDACLGELRRFHPLVGFGYLVRGIEQRIYADSMTRGTVALLLLLIPFTLLATLVNIFPWHSTIDIILLYFAIGWKSLGVHARMVKSALVADNLNVARQKIGLLVSRDTAALDRSEVTQATIESVLENGNDAVFGAIFWFVIAGVPGAAAYRLVNTLDAMWGYRNDRYLKFGWAAARLDDVLNFIPARLTALSYTLTGCTRNALACWKTQGSTWKSPNAGPVMAAGAGSLGVSLGGPAWYHGKLESRSILGVGRTPNVGDIDHALRLIQHSVLLWLLVLCLGEWLVRFIITA